MDGLLEGNSVSIKLTQAHTKGHSLHLTMLCGLFILQGQGTRMFWKPQPRTLSLVNKRTKQRLYHSQSDPLTTNYPSILTLIFATAETLLFHH